MRAFFGARPELAPTPARSLPGLAGELGVATLVAKDESARFGLNAFKLLGARFTIETLLAGGELRRGATVACASEGNHGRAVARAAREAGCAAHGGAECGDGGGDAGAKPFGKGLPVDDGSGQIAPERTRSNCAPSSSRSRTIRTRITTIGEKSSPPKSGRMRRTGR